MKRSYTLVAGLISLALVAVFALNGRSGAEAAPDAVADGSTAITMYKSATCVCCDRWGSHAEAAGYSVEAAIRNDMADVKAQFRVPGDLISCHTSVIGGYVVEGHVPVEAIEKMLAQRPKILGIAVAGMPAGSPGMDSDTTQPYNVIAFDEAGRRHIFARYGS